MASNFHQSENASKQESRQKQPDSSTNTLKMK